MAQGRRRVVACLLRRPRISQVRRIAFTLLSVLIPCYSHLAHHLYAAYGLGASPSVIRDAYQLQAKTQRKAFASPVDITEANWKEHLGDDKYVDFQCREYLLTFCKVLQRLSRVLLRSRCIPRHLRRTRKVYLFCGSELGNIWRENGSSDAEPFRER